VGLHEAAPTILQDEELFLKLIVGITCVCKFFGGRVQDHLLLFLGDFFNGVFCAFLNKEELKNTAKFVLVILAHVKNFLQNNPGEKQLPPVIFFLRFFISFLAVSLHDELKNTVKAFSKTRPEKKTQKTQKK
jgi:hypothetical protein